MTDRVLTEKEINSLAHLGEHGLGGLYGAEVRLLIASHRLLQKRVTELEGMVREGLGSEDLRQEVVRD